jgi:hypothetical protein
MACASSGAARRESGRNVRTVNASRAGREQLVRMAAGTPRARSRSDPTSMMVVRRSGPARTGASSSIPTRFRRCERGQRSGRLGREREPGVGTRASRSATSDEERRSYLLTVPVRSPGGPPIRVAGDASTTMSSSSRPRPSRAARNCSSRDRHPVHTRSVGYVACVLALVLLTACPRVPGRSERSWTAGRGS